MKKQEAVWMLAGGPMQVPAANWIRKQGYALLLSDASDKCACASLADSFVQRDTFDVEGNLAEVDELCDRYSICAVVAIAADCHETVAHLARHLGAPGLDPRIAHVCRYKAETREILTAAGIPQPHFARASCLAEARKWATEIGYPVALKAANNSGSRGFSRLASPDELTEESFGRALDNGTAGYVLVEELLEPVSDEIAEQSVETVWYEGRMYWLNWVDRLFREDFRFFPSLPADLHPDPTWGVELAHINPAVHAPELRREVHEMIEAAGNALGMNRQPRGHILKADIMLTTKGPRIIELTPRLSGGWDSSRSTPERGADFTGGALELALGRKLDLELWHRRFHYQDPNRYCAVVAKVEPGANDCIGRRFACGSAYRREEALGSACRLLLQKNYVVPLEQ